MSDQSEPIKRGPGRPPRAQETQVRRRRCQGMGAERNMKLHVPEESKDPNFTYRFVNDRPGRVRNLTTIDDWDIVSANELKGETVEQTSAAEGTVVRRAGDKFTGESMVLLKKLKEFYDSDKAAEQKLIDERDKLLRKGLAPEAGGLTAEDGAYVPGGKNIIAGK